MSTEEGRAAELTRRELRAREAAAIFAAPEPGRARRVACTVLTVFAYCTVLPSMNSASASADPFPDVKNALRATWLAARQQVRSAEASVAGAERALLMAKEKAGEVQRQIEAACPPLGLDPLSVMAEEDPPPPTPTSIPTSSAPSLSLPRGPRAQYDERVTDLLADGRLVAGEQLRTIHHGQQHFARLERDGSVSGPHIGSQPTLSAAARALVGGERNGWKFWSVSRDGRWVALAELRKG